MPQSWTNSYNTNICLRKPTISETCCLAWWTEFSQFEKLSNAQGDIALIIDYMPFFAQPLSVYAYTSSTTTHHDNTQLHSPSPTPSYSSTTDPSPIFISSKKKYKSVATKTRPVKAMLSEEFCIQHNIPGDPINTLPELHPIPPSFSSIGCYMHEQCNLFQQAHDSDFLLSTEKDLLNYFMTIHRHVFAWEDYE